MVEQFGLATIPSCSSARSPFTSGTTSGTPSCRRKASDLSTQTAPPLTACGTSSRLAFAPTEKKQRSKPASASGVASSTRSPPISLPAERLEANSVRSSKPRSRSRSTMTPPTAPVAPTTPILGMLALRFGGVELEGPVQGGDGLVHLVAPQVAGDLDRRGCHHGRLDADAGQRFERLRRDAGVALHAGADHADLAKVVARAPLDAEPVQHTGRRGAVVGGSPALAVPAAPSGPRLPARASPRS